MVLPFRVVRVQFLEVFEVVFSRENFWMKNAIGPHFFLYKNYMEKMLKDKNWKVRTFNMGKCTAIYAMDLTELRWEK
jgi:hypothetical protein